MFKVFISYIFMAEGAVSLLSLLMLVLFRRGCTERTVGVVTDIHLDWDISMTEIPIPYFTRVMVVSYSVNGQKRKSTPQSAAVSRYGIGQELTLLYHPVRLDHCFIEGDYHSEKMWAALLLACVVVIILCRIL